MATSLIEVVDLHRHFGDTKALNGVSFAIERGQSVGFIGANGAGKTTTMRIMATLDTPDRGQVLFNGQNVHERRTNFRNKLGWMPDAYGAYENMTIFEYLDFFSRSYGYRSRDREERIAQVMTFAELHELKDKYVDTLSKGMAQRLCLGRALLNDPDILILDEPAAGLDPKARIEFKHLCRLLAKEGKSLFISSHILSELEDICDTLIFLDAGKIVHHGLADTLKRETSGAVVLDIKVSEGQEKLREWLSVQEHITVREAIRDGFRIEFTASDSIARTELLKKLMREGLPVFEFHEHTRRLEDAFVEMMGHKKKT